jgi:hypothetical protein
MKRQLLTLTLAGLFGAIVLNANTASACCHKNRAGCAPVACAPAPAPEPAPAPAECPPPKKCCGLFGGGHKFRLFGHCRRQAVCAPVTCAAPAPVWVAPSPQATPQASGQS